MSVPRPSVYDPEFLSYPILALTSRVLMVTRGEVHQIARCEISKATQYKTKFPWAEAAGTYAQGNFIVAGGRCNRGLVQNNALRGEDPAKLVAAKPLPKPRARHAMATLPDGSAVLVGGVTIADDGCLELARELLRYDVKSDTWEVFAQLPKRACQLVAECVGDKLYVIAGDTGPVTEPERHAHPAFCRDDVQILDLASMKWTTGRPKPTPETGVTSAVLNGSIHVCSSGPTGGSIDALLEIYDPSKDVWEKAPNMPTPRTNVPAGFIDGRLYCVNGLGRGLRALSLVEIYDPKTKAWEILDSEPPACYASAYINVGGQALYIFGGRI